MDFTQDNVTIGKILMLKALRDMKNSNANLHDIDFDAEIEELYRDLEYPDIFSRKDIVSGNKKFEIFDFSRKTKEKSK